MLLTDAERIAQEIGPAVAADPEVADLTRVLQANLPADLVELVLFDFACTIRRATVVAVMGREAAE